MKISSKSNSTNNSKNYFIKEITITDIKDLSGKKIHESFKENADCALSISYTFTDKPEKEYDIKIGGSFKRNETGEVISQGTAQQVFSFFRALNVKIAIDTNNFSKFDPNDLAAIKGKKTHLLKYVYRKDDEGNDQFTPFRSFGFSKESLETYFLKQVADGWVKNFLPAPQPTYASNVIVGLRF